METQLEQHNEADCLGPMQGFSFEKRLSSLSEDL